MTWFKVDDTLGTHPKARDAGLNAMGLWVVAGSWSSQQLTDGAIPEWFVRTWPGAVRHADRLVDAGLWEPTEEGWRFHEWAQANPTRADVLEQRVASAERKARWRERHAVNGTVS